MEDIPVLQAKVETTYRHKETGELFKERKDWEARGFKEWRYGSRCKCYDASAWFI